MALGSGIEVWHLRNMPSAAAKLEPPGKHDAFYLPNRMHVTGDIDIHEMAWGLDEQQDDGEDKTRTRSGSSTPASRCLCTLDDTNSFVPRWRPHFVSALAPEDRCHLNGLGMLNGRPKFVTALGETDTAGGWRANKASGGILMDVDSNRVLMRGLSMPHSPRFYQGHLWLLESGAAASLARIWQAAMLSARHWRPSPSYPASRVGWTSSGRWPLSGCRRCARAQSSAGCR